MQPPLGWPFACLLACLLIDDTNKNRNIAMHFDGDDLGYLGQDPIRRLGLLGGQGRDERTGPCDDSSPVRVPGAGVYRARAESFLVVVVVVAAVAVVVAVVFVVFNVVVDAGGDSVALLLVLFLLLSLLL